MRLEDLPEPMRRQAEQQLGISRPTPKMSGGSLPMPTRTAETKKVHGIIHADKKKQDEEEGKKKSRKKEWLKPYMADTLVKRVEVSEDKNTVKFVLGCDPNFIPTAQEKGLFITKDRKAIFYLKKPQKDLETTLIMAMSKYRHLTREWGEVPIEVSLEYLYPYPKSTPKKDLFRISAKTTVSDVENLNKAVLDSLTRCDYKDKLGRDSWRGNGAPQKGFWKDDSFIVNLNAKKRFVMALPRVNIIIRNLKPQFDKLHEEELAERAKAAEEAKRRSEAPQQQELQLS